MVEGSSANDAGECLQLTLDRAGEGRGQPTHHHALQGMSVECEAFLRRITN